MNSLNILPIILLVILSSCGQRNAVNPKGDMITNSITDTIPAAAFHLDTSVIAILSVDAVNPWFFKDAKPTDLSNEDLLKVDQMLMSCINTHNLTQDTTKQFAEFIDLKKYKRQYVAFIDTKGERKVYVNCFCTSAWSFTDWKKTIVVVYDGGSCFFQVTINLTALKYEQFSTNGYG